MLLGFALAGSAERLPLKTYTTSDGLVRDYISRIVLDSHGFLWFCTPEGLEIRPGKATFFDHSFEIPMKQRVELRAVGITDADRDGKSK